MTISGESESRSEHETRRASEETATNHTLGRAKCTDDDDPHQVYFSASYVRPKTTRSMYSVYILLSSGRRVSKRICQSTNTMDLSSRPMIGRGILDTHHPDKVNPT